MEQNHSGLNTVGTNAPFFDGSQVCAQVDPELFFPDNHKEARARMKVVRPLCDSCQFKISCLEYALKHEDLYGIWGGTTDWDRRAMRKMKHRKKVA